MQLVLESDPGIHTVRRYGPGEVVIGQQRFTAPLIVAPRFVLPDWPVRSVVTLTEADCEPFFSQGVTILLLGEGTATPWPAAALRAALERRGIAVECMGLGAACRTYNVLAHEDRAVAAGLFP